MTSKCHPKPQPKLRVGRKKVFGPNITITVWKNTHSVCAACKKYKHIRFKITIAKPLGWETSRVFSNADYLICSKLCRAFILLRDA